MIMQFQPCVMSQRIAVFHLLFSISHLCKKSAVDPRDGAVSSAHETP